MIQNKTNTRSILVIQKEDTIVHVVDDISINHNDDDIYFTSLIYPSPENLASTTSEPATDSVTMVEIPKEYADLKAAFSDGLKHLPNHGPHDMHIQLVDDKSPHMGPMYNMSEAEMKIVHDYVKDMMAKGLIRPSTSPCGAPILFAKKKDGTLRLCVDYRRLNDMTVKNVYPLPLIDELLDRIASGKIFTTLDLKDAYWLLHIAEVMNGKLRSELVMVYSSI